MIWSDLIYGLASGLLGMVLMHSGRKLKFDGGGAPPARRVGHASSATPVAAVAAGSRPVTPSSAPVSPAAALERCECGHRHEHHRHRDPVKCHRCDRCAGFVLDTSPFPEATPSPSDTAEAFARLMSGHFG